MDPDLLLDPAQFLTDLTDSSYWGNEQARLLPERKFDHFSRDAVGLALPQALGDTPGQEPSLTKLTQDR